MNSIFWQGVNLGLNIESLYTQQYNSLILETLKHEGGI